jgi:cell division transport system permease protein
MAVSPAYVTREAATNLWRNRLMTVAAVMTAAVSLALVGSALSLRQGASRETEFWQNSVNTIVWVRPTAGPTLTRSIGSELQQSTYVKTCTYRSQAYDYHEAERLLPPDEIQATRQSDYPESYRCVLTNPSEAPAVFAAFTGKPGVQSVVYPGQQIKTMQTFIHVTQFVFLIVAVVLLAASLVFILITIRMAIFARRREISVMKLVGATNWFIRLPFMVEGLVQGVLGAAVAVLVVLGLYWSVLDHPASSAANAGLFSQLSLTGWNVFGTCLLVAVVGIGVGVAGSAFAVRRFLDV